MTKNQELFVMMIKLMNFESSAREKAGHSKKWQIKKPSVKMALYFY
jgi:hypothetical protein